MPKKAKKKARPNIPMPANVREVMWRSTPPSWPTISPRSCKRTRIVNGEASRDYL